MVINESMNHKTNDSNFNFSRWLASPPPGEEVVISGMSGKLPESNNIHEFRDNLFAKKCMVTDDDRRWTVDHPDIPKKLAKIYDIDKFDAGYFGVHYRQAHTMDPVMRTFMEVTTEAILDAGMNPSELKGSKTGVFISISWSDSESVVLGNTTESQMFGMTGFMRSLISHRISYFLKLKGPGCNVDTACSSSMNALDLAFNSIRSGQCENAIVGCGNLLMHPMSSLQFFRVGVLSRDGICKTFDQDADGYVRGEAVACVFLQKAKNSKRIYAQIVNIKANCDGFKEQVITFPSTQVQTQLLTEIYDESGIAPSELSYLEAHGTGTQVGDPQEAAAIDVALARKREKPLLVGSVKSNIGHTEPCSGICSIFKVLTAMETGLIPPNINFKQIKKGLKGFEEGRMKVVTELTKLEEDTAIVGINNFGFGGANVHVILKSLKKTNIDRVSHEDNLPRLVCVSGRTKQSVLKILDYVKKRGFDTEYVGLLHQIYKTNINSNFYRGFIIVSKSSSNKTSIKFSANQKSSLYVFFGRLENSFKILDSYFSKFPFYENNVSRIREILNKKKSIILDELKDGQNKSNEVLKALCVQIAIVDILKKLEIVPLAVYGDSYGKLACAYYYDEITLEDAICAAIKMDITDFRSVLHFKNCQNSQKVLKNSKSKIEIVDELQNGYSNYYEHCFGDHKNDFVFNVSDSHLNNKDVLLIENGQVMFLNILGRLFERGYNPQLHKLYPEIKFPVKRGTPMISPFIKWNHDRKWYTYRFNESTRFESEQTQYKLSLTDDENKFIAGHVIDGRNLFPATEYLKLVWQTLARSRHLPMNTVPVIFENCKFIRALTMAQTGYLNLLVTIQRGTGNFEIFENNSTVVSGNVSLPSNIREHQMNFEPIKLEEERTEILDNDEIYRELYLRGYNYSGVFKGLVKCNIQAKSGLITWENNWSSFMDKMLQMKILQTDTRLLHVPVGIRKLTIDPRKHLEVLDSLDDQEVLSPVYVYDSCHIIKSGGIEICGLQTKSISRKKARLEPVLEKHVFIPNRSSLELSEAIRSNIQIVLENSLENHFKAVEIIDDLTNSNLEPLSFAVSKVLDDVPMVTPDLTISAKNDIKQKLGVKVENVTLSSENNLLLIIATKLFQRVSVLKQILKSLSKHGFVLTREEPDFNTEALADVQIVTEYKTPNENLILFQKSQSSTNFKFIEVSSTKFEWMSKLQKLLSKESAIIAYCKNKEPEGILGLINCIRREPNGNKVKCVFMMDEAPEFDFENDFYKNQIEKNLTINIYKNGTWGSYRHQLLEKTLTVECEHCYANVKEKGNLSSIQWFEGPLSVHTPLHRDQILVSTYYSAINFKDVMLASGRVDKELSIKNRKDQDCLIGFEFSGKKSSGRRVMGMSGCGAMSSFVIADKNFLWEVPDEWSLEDAATVPVVYSTVLYALFMVTSLKPGSSILIHSATGGIGLAALNVCLHYKCDIYVTVGTQEKIDYLKKYYPQIPENRIGNSRDTSFEEMIKKQTRNRGVDLVLNSLSEEKLEASVRCLARGGLFLEIGKFDLANNTTFNLLLVEKGN